ncbi:alpha-amylase family glycosyl hydrolase [Rhodoplanes sp. TEM]|uniref:Alpha-amylase family glycosyl hydrolase n=1 Tax=Rhodoplanes tepidamans TaxID=200616 RepID=A0ABT5JB62_RHOTP|nr:MULTISPECIES: alpha-amylase family glycosyl hydrolase [Rhodoplanes]MDC7786909.1 alpha-amylase family glycosyl hydrolase [Rhodoplanes tepidamans]MDC7985375.1 alpha-amylase family glycosyl hydrolase [Rhodoplanes sp. TEM]MDQ0355395.1 alpha-glucosidase [Rhodoplanes tepidamans]
MDAVAAATTPRTTPAEAAGPAGEPAATWWQTGILYQIYPRSFQDSNGDGVGDLAGILARLPHLVELGVDALWLSPIYPSPMADFGYDISDYTGIDPVFGTLDDLDALLAAAHAHGLKVLLDLVPNHTSDRHPWFEESRSSRDNPKRDWYIWHDPAPDGGPPTNWLSEFGGSAWELDPGTGQYYYHAFLDKQPDLNWRNPAVRSAMYDVMRFWLGRGVDGFRVDVIWHLIKDDQFRDNPPNPDWHPGRPPVESVVPVYTADRPEVHEVIAEMRRVVEEFDSRVLIGEIYLPIERLVTYYGTDLSGAHLPFNFALLNAPWEARRIARLIDEYESALPPGGWPNWVLGNHDRPRVGSRIGREQLRVAAMLLLTLRGTPTIYYGEEIGMVDVAIPPDRIRDPFEKNVPGIGVGRDGCRTPMQWDRGESAGFSTAEPWLPTAPDAGQENVLNQRGDVGSLLNLYRRLIALRRTRPVLGRGSYEPIAASGDLIVYVRSLGRDRVMVALNLGAEPVSLTVRGAVSNGRILVSALGDRDGEEVTGEIYLRSHEGAVIGLDAAA